VLLPLLCSMVEAKLLREVNENYYATGYADDIAILLN
jgi:hypothetical protein